MMSVDADCSCACSQKHEWASAGVDGVEAFVRVE